MALTRNSLSIWSGILVILFTQHHISLADDSPGQRVCSVEEPTSSQVCVSIKFPWKEDPVFFCTDQGNINYTPQCTDPSQSHHCKDDARNDTLKIATPWDCCPIISTPNKCANVECPQEPFNRTCKIIKILGDCCPTYFCEPGEPDNCKASRLRVSCLNPPKDKVNCTAFRDPFGCCNKYQCAGEAKPGVCPRHGQKVKEPPGVLERIFSDAKQTVNKITHGVKSTLEKHGGEVGRAIANVIPIPFKTHKTPTNPLRCSGDYHCPGSMKCCRPLHHYTVAHHAIQRRKANNGDTTNTQVFRAEGYSKQIIDGVCIEPDPEGTVYESSMTSTSSSTENYNIQTSSSSTWRSVVENREMVTPPPPPPSSPTTRRSRGRVTTEYSSTPRGRPINPRPDITTTTTPTPEESNPYVQE